MTGRADQAPGADAYDRHQELLEEVRAVAAETAGARPSPERDIARPDSERWVTPGESASPNEPDPAPACGHALRHRARPVPHPRRAGLAPGGRHPRVLVDRPLVVDMPGGVLPHRGVRDGLRLAPRESHDGTRRPVERAPDVQLRAQGRIPAGAARTTAGPASAKTWARSACRCSTSRSSASGKCCSFGCSTLRCTRPACGSRCRSAGSMSWPPPCSSCCSSVKPWPTSRCGPSSRTRSGGSRRARRSSAPS